MPEVVGLVPSCALPRSHRVLRFFRRPSMTDTRFACAIIMSIIRSMVPRVAPPIPSVAALNFSATAAISFSFVPFSSVFEFPPAPRSTFHYLSCRPCRQLRRNAWKRAWRCHPALLVQHRGQSARHPVRSARLPFPAAFPRARLPRPHVVSRQFFAANAGLRGLRSSRPLSRESPAFWALRDFPLPRGQPPSA